MILSILVTSQLHFEMCAGLYGHPVFKQENTGYIDVLMELCLSNTSNTCTALNNLLYRVFLIIVCSCNTLWDFL